MRKILLAFASSLLLVSSAFAQRKVVEFRTGDAIHGLVKTVRHESAEFTMKDGVPVEGKRRLVSVKSYTPDGKRSETESYSRDGTLREKRVHVYDDGGNLIEEAHYDGENVLLDKKTYVRQGDELLTFDKDGKLVRRVFTLWNNKRDKVVENRTFDGNGALIERNVNTRDPETGKSIWTKYKGDGTLAERNEYSPFTNTKNDKQSHFNRDGSSAGERDVKAERTANGMTIEAVETNANGKVRRKTLKTLEDDARGNLIKQTLSMWNETAGKFVPYAASYTDITYY